VEYTVSSKSGSHTFGGNDRDSGALQRGGSMDPARPGAPETAEPLQLRADTRETIVNRLLGELRAGHRQALHDLLPLIYDELRALARAQRRRWHGNDTLDTTALVHEAYLKLVDQTAVDASSRAHFLALAAKAMRHLLCNYARDRGRQKRGGGVQPVSLDAIEMLPAKVTFSMEQADALAALDAALERLERLDARQVAVVECRFFGAMSVEETAAALEISPATVKRVWTLTRAWLYREMQAYRDC
jgi:RNA polymerase sigma factor (TIGR02999 family)